MNARAIVDRCIELALEGSKVPKDIIKYCDGYYSPYYGFAYFLMATLQNQPDVVLGQFAVELGVEKARCSYSLLYSPFSAVLGIDTLRTEKATKLAENDPRFLYLVQPSSQVPVEILQHKKISILHIDTEHSYGMAKMEFEAYFPYLDRPAFVLFDDTHAANDDVLKYVNELPYYKVIEDRLHPVCGYAIVIVE